MGELVDCVSLKNEGIQTAVSACPAPHGRNEEEKATKCFASSVRKTVDMDLPTQRSGCGEEQELKAK